MKKINEEEKPIKQQQPKPKCGEGEVYNEDLGECVPASVLNTSGQAKAKVKKTQNQLAAAGKDTRAVDNAELRRATRIGAGADALVSCSQSLKTVIEQQGVEGSSGSQPSCADRYSLENWGQLLGLSTSAMVMYATYKLVLDPRGMGKGGYGFQTLKHAATFFQYMKQKVYSSWKPGQGVMRGASAEANAALGAVQSANFEDLHRSAQGAFRGKGPMTITVLDPETGRPTTVEKKAPGHIVRKHATKLKAAGGLGTVVAFAMWMSTKSWGAGMAGEELTGEQLAVQNTSAWISLVKMIDTIAVNAFLPKLDGGQNQQEIYKDPCRLAWIMGTLAIFGAAKMKFTPKSLRNPALTIIRTQRKSLSNLYRGAERYAQEMRAIIKNIDTILIARGIPAQLLTNPQAAALKKALQDLLEYNAQKATLVASGRPVSQEFIERGAGLRGAVEEAGLEAIRSSTLKFNLDNYLELINDLVKAENVILTQALKDINPSLGKNLLNLITQTKQGVKPLLDRIGNYMRKLPELFNASKATNRAAREAEEVIDDAIGKLDPPGTGGGQILNPEGFKPSELVSSDGAVAASRAARYLEGDDLFKQFYAFDPRSGGRVITPDGKLGVYQGAKRGTGAADEYGIGFAPDTGGAQAIRLLIGSVREGQEAGFAGLTALRTVMDNSAAAVKGGADEVFFRVGESLVEKFPNLRLARDRLAGLLERDISRFEQGIDGLRTSASAGKVTAEEASRQANAIVEAYALASLRRVSQFVDEFAGKASRTGEMFGEGAMQATLRKAFSEYIDDALKVFDDIKALDSVLVIRDLRQGIIKGDPDFLKYTVEDIFKFAANNSDRIKIPEQFADPKALEDALKLSLGAVDEPLDEFLDEIAQVAMEKTGIIVDDAASKAARAGDEVVPRGPRLNDILDEDFSEGAVGLVKKIDEGLEEIETRTYAAAKNAVDTRLGKAGRTLNHPATKLALASGATMLGISVFQAAFRDEAQVPQEKPIELYTFDIPQNFFGEDQETLNNIFNTVRGKKSVVNIIESLISLSEAEPGDDLGQRNKQMIERQLVYAFFYLWNEQTKLAFWGQGGSEGAPGPTKAQDQKRLGRVVSLLVSDEWPSLSPNERDERLNSAFKVWEQEARNNLFAVMVSSEGRKKLGGDAQYIPDNKDNAAFRIISAIMLFGTGLKQRLIDFEHGDASTKQELYKKIVVLFKIQSGDGQRIVDGYERLKKETEAYEAGAPQVRAPEGEVESGENPEPAPSEEPSEEPLPSVKVINPDTGEPYGNTTNENKEYKYSDLRKIVKEVLNENTGQGYNWYPYNSHVGDENEPGPDYIQDWKDFELSVVRDESRSTAIELAKILVKDLELFGDVVDLVGKNQSVGTEILKKFRKITNKK